MDYLRRGLFESLSSPSAFADFVRRFGANIGYVSLSTFGILLPVVAWALIRPSRSGSWLVRLVALQVAIVAVVSAFVGAMHMTVYASPLNPLPRWDRYGRYMEHLVFPVTVLGLGLLVTARRSPVAEKLWVVGLTIAAGIAVWAVVPYSFFTRSMPNQIAPNSLGIAALIRVAHGHQLWWLALIVASAAVCVALVLGRSRLALISAPIALAVGRRVGVELPGRCAGGFAELASCGTRPEGVRRVGRQPSRPVPSGFCVDFEHVGASPVGFVKVLYLVAENFERVRTTREPEPCLGQLPFVTYRVFDGYRILFEDKIDKYRIYSTYQTS